MANRERATGSRNLGGTLKSPEIPENPMPDTRLFLVKTMYNPSLRQTPRHEPAEVIPLKQRSSLLDWLESTNRLLARDGNDPDNYLLDAEPEISDLMGADDTSYDDLDDDDEPIELEEEL